MSCRFYTDYVFSAMEGGDAKVDFQGEGPLWVPHEELPKLKVKGRSQCLKSNQPVYITYM